MTTTRIYKSTDTSAPVLVGGVSSLINLLDKCLVTGYGSATPAGWTKPYTGTDKACFRNSLAAGGTGMHIRVSDAGTGTGGAREALVRAYFTMTDVDTGTIETPTVAQLASVVWRKSDTVDSTPRAWILIADERSFYLWIDTGTSSNGNSCYAAGDFDSYIAGEAYPFFITGRNSQSAGGLLASTGNEPGLMTTVSTALAAPSTYGIWLARGYSGSGNPVLSGLMCPTMPGNSFTIGGSSAISNPSLGSGLNFYQPGIICAEATVRGRMRGVYVPLNSHAGVAAGTEITNPPGLTGTIVAMRHYSSQNAAVTASDGHVYVDRSSAWS